MSRRGKRIPGGDCLEVESGHGRHLWEITAVRDLFSLTLAVVALFLAYYLRDVFAPILISLGLAYLFDPVIDWAERHWRTPRLMTTLLLLVILAVTAIVMVAWLGPILARQAVSFVQNLPGYIDRLSKQYDLRMGDLPAQIAKVGEAIRKDTIPTFQTLFTGTGRFFGVLGSVIGITTSVVLFFLLVPVYFFFFAWRFPDIVGWFARFVPASRRARVAHLTRRIDDIVAAFFRARFLICVIMSALFAFGWTLVGVPYALLLGLITGFLSLVPFASFLGWPLALLLKYLEATPEPQSFSWMAILVWPSLVYLVVQFIEAWVLTPLAHRGSANLSAVTILIVVFIGGALGGVIGFILAIPVASSIKMILDETLVSKLEHWASRN